jgi:hypothetical protein
MNGIIHRTGAYQLNGPRELGALLKGHMSLVLDPPHLIERLEAANKSPNVRYIDDLVPLIFDNVQGLEPLSNPASCFYHGCVISPDDVQNIQSTVSAELQRAKTDPRIVGFYIQDDPIGNTRLLNQDIHAWIAQAGLDKPTICGFKGRLDAPSSRWWMSKLPNFAADIEGSYEQLNNYSPQACDMVALYPFDPQASNIKAARKLAKKTDWKMSKAVWPCGSTKCTLLNFYRYALRKRGWTRATPLIGVPQAFGFNLAGADGQGFVWPEPTSRQLAMETAAFCAGGVQSIVAYAWHAYAYGSTSPYIDPTLRNGLAAGAKACRVVWHHHPSRGTK